MSTLLDETAADLPVRDVTAAPPDSSHHVRARQDVSRVSRAELEDRYLRLHEETLLLKQHVHQQDDKIRKLGTKLMRLVKDRGRMEQLAAGVAPPPSRLRDVETEEMMEELQEKVRGLQADNDGLKQRLLVAKQQLVNSQRGRPSPYGHVQSRVNSGTKRLRDEASSPSQIRPKSSRSLDGGGRPPSGQLPRYGHSLLEEARAEIRSLENVVESQRRHMEELEGASELLGEELRRKEAECEERLLQARQQHTNKLRTHVSGNVTMIKLQKQLADRSNAAAELQGRFMQLQEQSQQALKTSHEAAMASVDKLSAELRTERLKTLELERRLQSSNISRIQMEQLQERISELEQEGDLLKVNNQQLVDSALDVSQQQRFQIQEQQLRLQVSQLETALNADLVDKNQILDRIKAERETNEKLTEENQKLRMEVLDQQQRLEEVSGRLRFYRDGDYDVAELTEALLLIKARKSQQNGDLGFLKEAEEEVVTGQSESAVRELRAAHAETIQELEKTRNLLSVENRISRDYKAELEAALRKMNGNKVEHEQKLERQAELLEARTARIRQLEARLKDIAYGARTYVLKPDAADGDEADGLEETLHLERGENLLELQIVSTTLAPPALQAVGDGEPSTFCTYSFYLFELHSTPVVTGREPRYGFTSRYVVSVDGPFLDFLRRGSVMVELHQALGLDWRTLATAQLPLQQLLEDDGKIHGSVPLVGSGDEVRSFGSLQYWLRFRFPVTDAIWLYREKMKAAGSAHSALSQHAQPSSSSWNQVLVSVHRCCLLQPGSSRQPSPYAVYKFFHFPDYPTSTVDDCPNPRFDDLRSYSVLMDEDLDQYLRSDVLQVYVLDYKEQQMDTYLGKARVSLLPLVHDQAVTGVFQLADPSGCPAGHIEVTLKWRFSYVPPPRLIPEAMKDEGTETPLREEEEEEEEEEESRPDTAASKVLPPTLRERTGGKEGVASKKVTFIEAADDQISAGRMEAPLAAAHVQAAPSSVEDEDDEDESHVSEGQLVPASAPSDSDDSEISEEITEDVEEVRAATEDQGGSDQSDSDDCIVHGQATGRKPSERLRVEVVSLSLRAESRAARDVSVVRLFVEYSFLDLPTEETPLSLPKPPPGRSINYNYSKVVPVDAENNEARRRLLRDVLQGRRPSMDRIRFTVVSEPPEEEEQERECEDVGVAFLSISDILQNQCDLTEAGLDVLDVEDSSEVLGCLVVSVEGLEALRSIMDDRNHQHRAAC